MRRLFFLRCFLGGFHCLVYMNIYIYVCVLQLQQFLVCQLKAAKGNSAAHTASHALLRTRIIAVIIAVGLVWNWSLRFNVAANVAAGSAVSLQCAQEKNSGGVGHAERQGSVGSLSPMVASVASKIPNTWPHVFMQPSRQPVGRASTGWQASSESPALQHCGIYIHTHNVYLYSRMSLAAGRS